MSQRCHLSCHTINNNQEFSRFLSHIPVQNICIKKAHKSNWTNMLIDCILWEFKQAMGLYLYPYPFSCIHKTQRHQRSSFSEKSSHFWKLGSWNEMAFHTSQIRGVCVASIRLQRTSHVLRSFYTSELCKRLKTGGHTSLTLTRKSLLLCLPGNLCKPMLSTGSFYRHFHQRVNWKVALLTYQMLCKLLFKPRFPFIPTNT